MAQTQQVKGPEQQGEGKFQTSVSRRHLLDRLFTGTVFVATLLGIVALAIFLIDVAREGVPRLSWQFLTSFPSQIFPENSGIYPALIGSLWLLGLTALFSVPLVLRPAISPHVPYTTLFFLRVIIVRVTVDGRPAA